MIKELKAKVKKDKKIGIIKNENLKLLCDLNAKKAIIID